MQPSSVRWHVHALSCLSLGGEDNLNLLLGSAGFVKLRMLVADKRKPNAKKIQ